MIMEKNCKNYYAGCEIVDFDVSAEVRGGKGGFFKMIAEFILRYSKEFIMGFWDGWNEKDWDYSF